MKPGTCRCSRCKPTLALFLVCADCQWCAQVYFFEPLELVADALKEVLDGPCLACRGSRLYPFGRFLA